jgi:hypothetical protein
MLTTSLTCMGLISNLPAPAAPVLPAVPAAAANRAGRPVTRRLGVARPAIAPASDSPAHTPIAGPNPAVNVAGEE